jgi:hypothetical protein
MAGIMSSLAICLAMTPSPSQKEGEEDKWSFKGGTASCAALFFILFN